MQPGRTIRPASEHFYDRISFLYPLIDLFLKPQKKKFFGKINGYPHGRLLEIGVGDGENLKYYTKHAITGVDTSRAMLARAMARQKANIHLVHMNGESLAFHDDSFDYVTLSHVISVVDDPDQLMSEVHRVLKPGGKVFILNHFTPANPLKHLDRMFSYVSGALHFRSLFYTSSLGRLEKFKLVSETDAGFFSYFKILIYEKTL